MWVSFYIPFCGREQASAPHLVHGGRFYPLPCPALPPMHCVAPACQGRNTAVHRSCSPLLRAEKEAQRREGSGFWCPATLRINVATSVNPRKGTDDKPTQCPLGIKMRSIFAWSPFFPINEELSLVGDMGASVTFGRIRCLDYQQLAYICNSLNLKEESQN